MGLRSYECADLPADGGQLNIKDITFEDLVRLNVIDVYVDSNGALKWKWKVNTSGVFPVTEASAASINQYQNYMMRMQYAGVRSFGAADPTSGAQVYIQPRIFSVDLTSDGAGAVAATTIVPNLAGYTGHAQIVGVWAHATDAATTFTFACAGGTLLGPAVHVVATTANSITQFGAAAANVTGCPVYIRGTVAADDNKALTVTVAGYAATETLTIFGYYWYET